MLDDAACTRKKALAAWDKVFNTDFFSQREASKAAAAAAVASPYGGGPRVISNGDLEFRAHGRCCRGRVGCLHVRAGLERGRASREADLMGGALPRPLSRFSAV